jgi:hypothetical protein
MPDAHTGADEADGAAAGAPAAGSSGPPRLQVLGDGAQQLQVLENGGEADA